MLFDNLKQAATAAADVFEDYARNHRAKSPPQVEKAERNETLAAAVRAAVDSDVGVAEGLRNVAATIGAYALNVAYGNELAPFELENLTMLAKAVGATVEDRHLGYARTRAVLGRVLKERHVQVERYGYTAEHDARNAERLREQVLERVQAMPTEREEQNLLEAATIIVAELEQIDRQRKPEPGTPVDGVDPVDAAEANAEIHGAPI